MTKAEMRTRLKLRPRAFETFTMTYPVRPPGRQVWQIRVDGVDAQTRQRIESAR